MGRSAKGIGCGGILLLIVVGLVFGPETVLSLLGGATSSVGPAPGPVPAASRQTSAAEEELVDFVSFILDDSQQFWAETLPRYGNAYREANLVLFRQAVVSRCGQASARSGPFYCPGDEKVYIDLSFYDDLRRRFGAPGDFAQAYVLAHEIGHHVQTVLGTSGQVRQLQQREPRRANDLSVRLELQADCYAGVWARSTHERGLLDPGDIEEGMGAAASVGDDRIQQETRGHVNPDSFTHGTSEQRVEWFRIGLNRGDPTDCDTFR